MMSEGRRTLAILGEVCAAADGWRTVCERSFVATADERLELVAVATEMEAAAARLRGLAVDAEPEAAVVHFAGFVPWRLDAASGADRREHVQCSTAVAEGEAARVVGLPARVTCRVCAERLTAMGRR